MECRTPKPRNRPEMGGFYSHLVVEDPRILVARTQWQTKQIITVIERLALVPLPA